VINKKGECGVGGKPGFYWIFQDSILIGTPGTFSSVCFSLLFSSLWNFFSLLSSLRFYSRILSLEFERYLPRRENDYEEAEFGVLEGSFIGGVSHKLYLALVWVRLSVSESDLFSLVGNRGNG
jgi:hypothetical protein